ncbi:MAG TPA: hypothetical protein VFG04_12955 [Planctomycetaceae bacterium]|nr:hypothetical protein [Planctomycetaceae bacterium]
MPVSRRTVALSLALAGGCAACGCTFLKPFGDVFGFWPPATISSGNVLPPLQPSREAVQIDFTFVERPVGDPLLGTALWGQIDQVGALSASEAEALKRMGLRVGNAGSSICPALERILSESAPADASASATHISVKKETLCIGPGVSPPITTNSGKKCTIDVPSISGSQERTFENFKNVLRLTPHRLQDEWVRLEFVPEVHFGQEHVRPMSATVGLQSVWQPEMAQEVECFLQQRFSVKMHVGEMVVISADAPENARLFGTHAFVRNQPGTGILQRVLIVRLANMSRIDPVYSQSGGLNAAGR